MAICPVGTGHFGSFPPSNKETKISPYCYRLFHQVGGGWALGTNHRTKGGELLSKIYHLSVWATSHTHNWQWPTIWQSSLQKVLWGLPHKAPIYLSRPSSDKWGSKNYQSNHFEEIKDQAWWRKGQMGWWTTWSAIGIPYNSESCHQWNSF